MRGLPNAGAKGDVSTFGRLEIGGRFFTGRNAWYGEGSTIRGAFAWAAGVLNNMTAWHAEGDVFDQAKRVGVVAQEATFYVDRDLCDACGQYGGLRNVARRFGLKALTVYTPQGQFLLDVGRNEWSPYTPWK